MRRVLVRCIAILFVLAAVISVAAQDTANPGEQDTTTPAEPAPAPKRAKKVPQDKPPDLVCFGEGPDWSIQFVSWGARSLGINQPDQDFPGNFFWLPDEKLWLWQMGGGSALSARIRTASCTDPVRKGTFPYAALVYLPHGDIRAGCCRKLKAEEAPAGPHGLPSNNTPPQ
ncbi:MAG: hypothetical protein ABSD98_11145 [Candidatus Korobacteraceae bacterium]